MSSLLRNSTVETVFRPFPITQQNKGSEANRTRKFTRTFGKIFVTQLLCGTFSVTNIIDPKSDFLIRRSYESLFSQKVTFTVSFRESSLLVMFELL